MSQIDQIQFKFVPAEDRLLLRLSTNENTEFRFWLSRRFVRMLWPVLARLLVENPRIKTQVSAVAQRELLAFEHQKAIDSADFSTPYKEHEQKTLPMGHAPVLLTRFQVRAGTRSAPILSVGPEQGPGIDLSLNPGLIHSVVELLTNAVKLAEWDLPPMIETGNEPVDSGEVTVN